MKVKQPASKSVLNTQIDPSTSIALVHAPGGVTRGIAGGGEMDGDGDKEMHNEDEDEEDEDEDDDDDSSAYITASVNNTLQKIEAELGITNRLLRKNVSIRLCDADFEDIDEPRSVETLSRINSPTQSDKYIDVHLSYHCHSRYCSMEWAYTIGFKISRHSTPYTSALKVLRERPTNHRYGTQGWRSIAYGLFDDRDPNNSGKNWRCIELFSFDMDMDGLVDVHESLWGPLAELPPDVSEEDKTKRRETLIRALRVLLAAVGIDYYISCRDERADIPPSSFLLGRGQLRWMLEGAGDRWLARGAREACGFQLERDPEEERKGREGREEMARGDSDEQAYSDGDGYGF